VCGAQPFANLNDDLGLSGIAADKNTLGIEGIRSSASSV
jgi:hypothetical protein